MYTGLPGGWAARDRGARDHCNGAGPFGSILRLSLRRHLGCPSGQALVGLKGRQDRDAAAVCAGQAGVELAAHCLATWLSCMLCVGLSHHLSRGAL